VNAALVFVLFVVGFFMQPKKIVVSFRSFAPATVAGLCNPCEHHRWLYAS
jgi:hypothetical protein